MSGSQRPPGYLPPHLRVMTPPASPHASRTSSIASRLTQPTAVQSRNLQAAESSAASTQSSDSSNQTLKSAKVGDNVTLTAKTESRQQPTIPCNPSSKPSAPVTLISSSHVKSGTSDDTLPHLRSLQNPVMPAKSIQPSASSTGITRTMDQTPSKFEKDGRSTKTGTPVAKAAGASITVTTWQQLANPADKPSKERTARKPAVDVVAKSTKNYPCSYVNCPIGFDTLRGLKHHKRECHDYCRVCDVDCKDAPEFLTHKIKSEKHIVCPICSEDFKSSMGRDRHLKQFHMTEQNIVCPGCSTKFTRAGGFMEHIESNRCGQISSDDLDRSRALQAFNLARVSAMMVQDDERDFSMMGSEAGDDSSAGGVPLMDMIDSDDDEALFDQAFPALADVGKTKITKDIEIATTVKEARVRVLSGPGVGTAWPALGSAIIEQPTSPPWSIPSASNLFPNAPPNPVVPRMIGDLTINDPDTVLQLKDSSGSVLDTRSPDFNPHKFLNAIDKFACPYPTCGKSFKTASDFKAHLESLTHRGVDHRCPYCLKIFKSPTALTQHMEAPSTRCRIKESTHFERAVNLVSGGFLEVSGRHVDSSVRYDATEPQW